MMLKGHMRTPVVGKHSHVATYFNLTCAIGIQRKMDVAATLCTKGSTALATIVFASAGTRI
jgi:hypothetical protein